jgi:hypothetical protein
MGMSPGSILRNVFIEETLPDRVSARLSCPAARAGNRRRRNVAVSERRLNLGQADAALDGMRTMSVLSCTLDHCVERALDSL